MSTPTAPRAERRRQAKSAKTPAPPRSIRDVVSKPKTRVFNQHGEKVTLRGETFHLAKLTVAGITDIQEYLSEDYPATNLIEAPTVGEQLVAGAAQAGDWEPLQGLIARFIHEHRPDLDEPLDENLVAECGAEELIIALNQCFAQTGLSWLEEIIKNLAVRVSQVRRQVTSELIDADIKARMDGAREQIKELVAGRERTEDGETTPTVTPSETPTTTDANSA